MPQVNQATEGAIQQNQQNQQGQQTTPKQEPKQLETFTKEQVDQMLQSEADKRVTEALKTAKATWQKEQEDKIKEAEKLAKLSEEEKTKFLMKQREEEIAERERAINQKELEMEAMKVLEQKNLPIKFAYLFKGGDATAILDSINGFEKEWRAELEKQVNERLKGAIPKSMVSKDNKDETTDMNAMIRQRAYGR